MSREPDALNEELESMAASVEVGMSPEYGTVSLSTMAEDIEKGLEIFADVLRNPAFPRRKNLNFANSKGLKPFAGGTTIRSN